MQAVRSRNHAVSSRSRTLKDDNFVRSKQIVSAAAVFKRPILEPKRRISVTRSIPVTNQHSVDGLPIQSHQFTVAKSGSSSRSPQKKGHSVTKRKRESEKHTLALAFDETTTAYRTHLYEDAAAKINATYNDLLEQLGNLTVRDVVSPANPNGADSPLRMTLAAQIRYESAKYCLSIGDTALIYERTVEEGENGENTDYHATLDERIQQFGAHIKEEEREMKGLQQKWERIVGEIWKCSVQILGEEDMSLLLSPRITPVEQNDSLFVPEHGDNEPTHVSPQKPKKRVSFQEPLPAFLTQPSRLAKLPRLQGVDRVAVQEIEDEINQLGSKHVAQLAKQDAEHKVWWDRKQEQIMHALTH